MTLSPRADITATHDRDKRPREPQYLDRRDSPRYEQTRAMLPEHQSRLASNGPDEEQPNLFPGSHIGGLLLFAVVAYFATSRDIPTITEDGLATTTGRAILLQGQNSRTGSRSARSGSVSRTTSEVSIPRPNTIEPAEQNFSQFLASLKTKAVRKGVRAAAFNQAMSDMEPDPDIIGFTTRQPEHDKAPWDYVGTLVSDKRVADGRLMMGKHSTTLTAIEAAYGVDKHVVTAIWGVESSYGSGQGGRNVLRSLATLAHQDKRRSSFWTKQLIAALKIVANGDIASEDMSGSWAGAMGHTQFMPTTYAAHAVDFDGDGRRNIWTSVPDALASTANYLLASKWRKGQPWGYEVILPARFEYSLSASGNAKPIDQWVSLGITAPIGQILPVGSAPLRLILPAGARGPAFLVSGNFKSILRYNNSVLYALSVGLLAQRLKNQPPLQSSWPKDVLPLQNAAGRKELQQLLVDHGYDTGGIDGILGSASRVAIMSYQQNQSLPADGFPSVPLLQRLRRTSVALKQQR